MTGRIWDKYISDEDRKVLSRAGYHQPMGFGERPAVVVVDVSYNFVGDREGESMDEVLVRWPNACGPAAWAALPHIRTLMDCAHDRGLPVFLTTDGFREDGWDKGSWLWKSGRAKEWDVGGGVRQGPIGAEIHPGIGSVPTDIVLKKLKPSAFNGTALFQLLTLARVDTLIVAGTTTSGCVRATVIEAFSNNFRVIVHEEGCFDRVSVSHAINLCDMDAKYADVLSTDAIVSHVSALDRGLFDLPRG